MELNFVIDKECDIKSALRERGFSGAQISKLLLDKSDVFVNGEKYETDCALHKGDTLRVVRGEESTTVKGVDKPIDIAYEDSDFLVVDKPKGLATIPSRAHYGDNLAGRVVAYWERTNQKIGIHVVNRLDLLTSGLVVFAKSKYVHNLMAKVHIDKRYECIVSGIMKGAGTIDAPIDRVGDTVKREVNPTGKRAITEYTVVKTDNGNTLLDIRLLTGRTHQIRVHLSHVGHPLVGDTLYNDNATASDDFYLRCYRLTFTLRDKQYDLRETSKTKNVNLEA